MIAEKLAERKIPAVLTFADGRPVVTEEDWKLRRAEILELLQREEYGFTPAAPEKVNGEALKSENAFAGKAVQSTIRLSFDTPNGEFAFPFTLITPTAIAKAPVFVGICFRPDIPDRYLPVEEIIDHGFALACFYYNDVTDDSAKQDGLATMYPIDPETGWGKLGMWAFAASRVLDYLETRDEIDTSRACVCGHSRLGKTALWCAAQDERFGMAVSNDSGCSGAAITRGKLGEHVSNIFTTFPYWFCGNYGKYMNREDEMPLEQHMLLSLVAPRFLYVNSAEKDEWADPESEFLSCAVADEVWKLLGLRGLVTPDAMPALNEPLHEGEIGYHVRTGTHFYSRTDWLFQMAYREKHGI